MTVHVGTNAVAARVVRDGAVRAAPARTASRRCARRPRRPAHRHDGRRRRRARPCAAARSRSRTARGARSRNTRGDRRSSRARARDRDRPAGARPAGACTSSRVGWRRSALRVSTTSPRPGFASCRRACTCAWLERASTKPARPGRAAGRARAPGARGRQPVLEPARARAPRREGVPAGCHGRARRAAQARPELEARLAQEEIAKVDDKELAAFLEDAERIRRVGDGYAVSAALYDRGRELLPTPGADHARVRSATRSASAAGRPSCCWSATTLTA